MDKENLFLTPEELDTIGEIMNISIGASATALSTMLEKQVTITAPETEQEQFSVIDCSDLEPAVIVKINYVEGIKGVNVMMFKRSDMQIIVDLLMGNDEPVPAEDFVFDEMSLSAASEVMNQMMGAAEQPCLKYCICRSTSRRPRLSSLKRRTIRSKFSAKSGARTR